MNPPVIDARCLSDLPAEQAAVKFRQLRRLLAVDLEVGHCTHRFLPCTWYMTFLSQLSAVRSRIESCSPELTANQYRRYPFNCSLRLLPLSKLTGLRGAQTPNNMFPSSIFRRSVPIEKLKAPKRIHLLGKRLGYCLCSPGIPTVILKAFGLSKVELDLP